MKLTGTLLLLFCLSGIFISCNPDVILEENTSFERNKWFYSNRPVYYVTVEDTISPYTIFFKVRHTGNYKYSNLFILFTVKGPDKPEETQQYEFRLANPDGMWLGSGLGDIYSNRIVIAENIRFPRKGTYKFIIAQNMRDNPLSEIEDIGLRVEKNADPVSK